MRKFFLLLLLVTSCAIPPYAVHIRSEVSQIERDTFYTAINIWNAALNTTAFRTDGKNDGYSVVIYKTVTFEEPEVLAEARVINLGVAGIIAFSQNIEQPLLLPTFLHELGHLLGLQHVEEADSVMQAVISSSATKPSRKDVERARRFHFIPFWSSGYGRVCKFVRR